MNVAIQLSAKEQLRALPILFRHSPGMMLPNRIFVISPDAARCLKDAGVRFKLLARTIDPPSLRRAAKKRITKVL